MTEQYSQNSVYYIDRSSQKGNNGMQVVGKHVLDAFYERYPDCKQQLEAWHAEAKKAKWGSPNQVRGKYGKASIVGNSRVVFNICNNKYRLVVKLNYDLGVVRVHWIGTHTEYDKINVETV
jgi:mRNA interferase HigB